jgi:hypothetical protein
VVGLIKPWCSFLAGDRSGDCGQERVEVLASAEMSRQDPPVPQVADAVLDRIRWDAWARRSTSCAAATAVKIGIWFLRRAGRGVSTAPAVCVLSPW